MISTYKYLPATLIIGVSLLIELVIASLIPHFIVEMVLIFLGFCTAIVGLVFAAKLDDEYVNRKNIIIIFCGILTWVLSIVLNVVGQVTLIRATSGIIALMVSVLLLWIAGHLMIIIAGFKMNYRTLPAVASFGKVAKLLVTVPFSVLFSFGLISRVITYIGLATNGSILFALPLIGIINLVISVIVLLVILAGLIVGIVRYIQENREIEIPKSAHPIIV